MVALDEWAGSNEASQGEEGSEILHVDGIEDS